MIVVKELIYYIKQPMRRTRRVIKFNRRGRENEPTYTEDNNKIDISDSEVSDISEYESESDVEVVSSCDVSIDDNEDNENNEEDREEPVDDDYTSIDEPPSEDEESIEPEPVKEIKPKAKPRPKKTVQKKKPTTKKVKKKVLKKRSTEKVTQKKTRVKKRSIGTQTDITLKDKIITTTRRKKKRKVFFRMPKLDEKQQAIIDDIVGCKHLLLYDEKCHEGTYDVKVYKVLEQCMNYSKDQVDDILYRLYSSSEFFLVERRIKYLTINMRKYKMMLE